MRTRVILARHGITDWNKKGRYQGRFDTSLSPEGVRQSQALAVALKKVTLSAIYSSPLKRALKTAELVAKDFGLKVISLHGLTEICHGRWQGMLVEDVEQQYAELLRQWKRKPYEVRMPAGESLTEVEERAWEAFQQMTRQNLGQIVLAVTHDVPIRVILKKALNWQPESFWSLRLDSCGISVIEGGGEEWQLLVLNDTCHLGGWLCTNEQRAL